MRILIAFLIVFVPALALSQEKRDELLYPEKSADGRPATVRMMVGSDGKAGSGEMGFTENQILEAVEVNKKGEIIGGKYKELEKIANDLLKNQVPGEMPTPIGPAKTPIPHAYDHGTTAEEVDRNNRLDEELILHDETFNDCMDYKVLDFSGCLQILPDGQKVYTPFVKYHGPPQKVENVDQPLRTGYMTKEDIKKIIGQYETVFYAWAGAMVEHNILSIKAAANNQLCIYNQKEQGYSESQARKKCQIRGIPWKDPPKSPEFIQKALDDMRSGTVDPRFIFRNYDNPNAGYVYNEYHLMPTYLDLRFGKAAGKAWQDFNVIIAWLYLQFLHVFHDPDHKYTWLDDPFVHVFKQPVPVWSDFPDHMRISRHTGVSVGLFQDWMVAKAADPKMCASWNRNFSDNYENLLNAKESVMQGGLRRQEHIDSDRKTSFDNFTSKNERNRGSTDAFRGTPKDMLQGYVDLMDYNPYADALCQGANQGHWLPLTTRVTTPYHTVAASIGTVRAIRGAARRFPGSNYWYSYHNQGGQPEVNQDGEVTKMHDGDKVQWLRNAYMDRDPNGRSEAKACHSIDRWVKKFGEANIKHYTDDPNDKTLPSQLTEFTGGHWYVAAHWRYWRGCLDAFAEATTPQPIGKWVELGEIRD